MTDDQDKAARQQRWAVELDRQALEAPLNVRWARVLDRSQAYSQDRLPTPDHIRIALNDAELRAAWDGGR